MDVYRVAEDGSKTFVFGPADLDGVSDDLLVVGEIKRDEMARWAAPIGLAVLRGSNVRRV